MNADQEQEVLRLLKGVADCTEVYQVTTYRCYRYDQNGEQREVTVEVRDAGADMGDGRYSIRAWDDGGRRAVGNAAGDLETAFIFFHWFELDRDRP